MAKKNNDEEGNGTNTPATQTKKEEEKKPLSAKELFEADYIKKRFQELLGKNSQGFITSILQVVTNDKLLRVADPYSIYNAACTAAIMGLSINPNLGHAYIIGYKDNTKGGAVFAQFQIGWKGLVQLGQRSAQFKHINTTEIYENQFEARDYITGAVTIKNIAPLGKVHGYLAYFKLLNGFEKVFYMDAIEMKAHASRYSQSYKMGFGTWSKDENGFNAMGKKTVLKLSLSKYAPLSIEMQKAITLDQAVINDEAGTDFNYIDNQSPEAINKEEERIKLLIDDCTNVEDLEKLLEHCNTPELEAHYSLRKVNIKSLTA